MAKKKNKKKENINVQLQKLANSAQIQVQKLANESTEKSFQFNSSEAAVNRQWQKEMSDTSHQREVADLKAAGLNPVLSANQGAMSYTSSSASAQANDPSSTVGNIAGTTMSNIAGIYQTKMASAAQLQAAKASAAAMKSAAAASAAAQKYAADRAYAANKYAWDMKNKLTRDSWKNAPQGTIAGVIDKHLGNTGIPKALTNSIKKFFSGLTSKQVFSTFKSNNNFSLSNAGKIKVNASLRSIGVPVTSYNQKYFVKGFVLGNRYARNYILNQRRRSSKW